MAADFNLTERTVRELVTDLETIGLLDTWIESRGREGRVKQIETSSEPQWARDAMGQYLKTTEQVTREDLLITSDDRD